MGRKFKKGCLNALKAIAENQTEMINVGFRQAEALKEANDIKRYELSVKDRVDISLKEYEYLKNELAKEKGINAKLGVIMAKFGLAEFVENLIPQTGEVETMKDPQTLTTKVTIRFDVKNTM